MDGCCAGWIHKASPGTHYVEYYVRTQVLVTRFVWYQVQGVCYSMIEVLVPHMLLPRLTLGPVVLAATPPPLLT